MRINLPGVREAALGLLLSTVSVPGPARADDGYPPDHLADARWQLGEATALSLHGWLVLDSVTFERAEAGYGRSVHSDLRLRAAKLGVRIDTHELFSARFDAELAADSLWVQEAWVEVNRLAWLSLRAGRVRVPFGLAQNTRLPHFKLLEAPLVAGNPKDFYDVGAVLHGVAWAGRVAYAAGVVTGSRDIAVEVNERPDVAGRLRLYPLRETSELWQDLHLGASATWGTGPLRHGFRGRTIGRHTFADPPTIRGEQRRWGVELQWQTPWFRLAAEYQQIRQARDGISDNQLVEGTPVEVEGLEPYVVSGWYVEASWHVLGERGRTRPVTGLEIAGRFERIFFEDGSRRVTLDGREVDRAPLGDSHVDGLSASVAWHFGYGVRAAIAWQGLWFADETLAPTWEHEGQLPAGFEPATSPPVHHLFARLQVDL